MLVGLGASIPLGPIGVLCIQRTINHGRFAGLFSGLGAAVADTLFAVLAVFGLAIVQQIIHDKQALFLLSGGITLIILGMNIYLTNPIKQLRRNRNAKGRYFEKFISSFLLTLSNPGAIFLLLGLFALLQIDLNSSGKLSVSVIFLGVFLGAAVWWFTLTTLVNKFRHLFRIRQLMIINKVTGVIIVILGLVSLIDGLMQLIHSVV